jgi:hypothetical protein
MKRIFLYAITCIPFLLPGSASAHPGHGETEGFSITHYFTEPVHATATIGMIIAIVAGINYLRKRQSRDKQA